MEVGTQHVAKLEPFLLMSKAAKGAAAAKLIQDATSAPGVFVFAELLEQPNVQEVCQFQSSFDQTKHADEDDNSWLHMNSTLASIPCFSCSPIRHTRITSVEYYHPEPLRRCIECDSEHKDVLPPLNDAQITKLKQLTLVSLAQNSRVRRLVCPSLLSRTSETTP